MLQSTLELQNELSDWKITPILVIELLKLTITLCPRRAKALGKAPATSPSPPKYTLHKLVSYAIQRYIDN